MKFKTKSPKIQIGEDLLFKTWKQKIKGFRKITPSGEPRGRKKQRAPNGSSRKRRRPRSLMDPTGALHCHMIVTLVHIDGLRSRKPDITQDLIRPIHIILTGVDCSEAYQQECCAEIQPLPAPMHYSSSLSQFNVITDKSSAAQDPTGYKSESGGQRHEVRTVQTLARHENYR